jgi:shikimate dehydrogenase
MITATTRLCSSFANPNNKTPVPVMHNAGFEAAGVDLRYFAFEPADIASAMTAVRTLNFAGATISKPFKQDVMNTLDGIDEVAAKIGAVNVVHNDNGRLIGYNSDWVGALDALEEHGDVRGSHVAVLGAGGAARAVVYGLIERGASVSIYNRSADSAAAVAEELGARYAGALDQAGAARHDILINTTSFGHGNQDDVPVPDTALHDGQIVMDIVIRPDASPFLRRAADAGAHTIDGIRMLVLQGVFAFEKFTGVKAPVEVMQRAVRGWYA